MSKFSVAIVGGGISGLCLAGELLKAGDIQVDVYESSDKFNEVGAGVTLWGRVCDAMRQMDLADDCIKASVIAASSTGLPTTTGFRLRGFHQMDVDFGSMPMTDAWSLHRADLLHLLLRRVPECNTHLGKKLVTYVHDDDTKTTKLTFSDGTSATCDLLVACDGIRSYTRDQMMKQEAQAPDSSATGGSGPRWSGTIAYRALIPSSSIIAKNPNHSVLTGGQIYLGKSQHIVAYPIPPATTNVVVNVTDLSKENTKWPASSWSRKIDQKEFAEKIAPLFADWDSEPRELIQAIDSSIEWAIHDLEPLPSYIKGRVVLIGDAVGHLPEVFLASLSNERLKAHASMPYTGAGAGYGLEDAYVLSSVLRAKATNRGTLTLALEAYEAIRLPYGKLHTLRTREALRTTQYNGPHGSDMEHLPGAARRIFHDVLVGKDGSGPEADANKAILLLETKASGIYN